MITNRNRGPIHNETELRLEFESYVTKDFLVECSDSESNLRYIVNRFGYLKFIGTVIVCNPEEKEVVWCSFESDIFNPVEFKTEEWVKFDNKLKDSYNKYKNSFSSINNQPKVVII